MRLSALYTYGLMIISTMLLSVRVCGAEVSQVQLERVEQQVHQQEQKRKKLEQEAEKVDKDLKKVNQELIKAAKMIQNNEESISQMEERLELLEKDYEQTQERLFKQDNNMVKTLSALQSLALKPTEALFVQPLSPVDIVRSAMLLRETVPFLEAQADIIKQELEDLGRKREVIRNQVKKIVAQKSLLEREHAQMKVLADKKAKYKNQVVQQSVQTRKQVAKLAGQAQDLRDLLNKLEQEKAEKAKKALEERKRLAEEAKQKIFAKGEKSEQVKSADLIKFNPEVINEIGRNFAKAKGALSRPARGAIVSRYGEASSSGVTSKGIIIKTRNQAQVVSPFDGSVLFAGPFRGYGNLIIIEHGQGYTSLLAGLDSIDCELGQMLLAGEPIGLMPNSGNARLYMELRKDNHPINPEPWIEK